MSLVQGDFFNGLLAPLLRQRPDLTFFMIGDPNASDTRYTETVRLCLDGIDGIVTTGKRHDMPEVLRSLDVLLTLSGGSVMLEAMASGIPVVSMTSRAPSKLRIVRHQETGVIVGEGDWEGLVRWIELLCDDPALREKLGCAGRERARAHFGVEEMIARTEDVYRALLSTR